MIGLGKRSNVLHIIDFGLAKHLPENFETRMATKLGTPYYMSPEILRHETHDKKVDIWSLGILLFELTHGYAPF